ncbi:uncharacterized protein LOC111623333 [Centruroides sculpturatus]|uniref:uncharacterized protein LOC111623333 n=1 Tax=Centruroides sculpturatus TaxID=218467 RepID=UPI000C6ED5DD|nr:uncharacterized protein LOC111623333 [Centruroides sculpturatus]
MNTTLDYNCTVNNNNSLKLTHFPTPSPENNYWSDISDEDTSSDTSVNNPQRNNNYPLIRQDLNCYPTPPQDYNYNPYLTQNNSLDQARPRRLSNEELFADSEEFIQKEQAESVSKLLNNWIDTNPGMMEVLENELQVN